MRFTRIGEEITAGEQIISYRLELRPGHTIHRDDHISRLGAGRKGRAAEVSLWREMVCTCGGHLSYGGLTVAEDMANLKHFESDAERVAYEEHNEAIMQRILKQLGMDS